ncbi:MAG TPA: hypothetical protein V6D17_13305 [Candidatus Obscuribacterales bacterium]
MLLKITVTTVDGRPTIAVSGNLTPAQVRKIVANHFGYQAIGVPHTWYGVRC